MRRPKMTRLQERLLDSLKKSPSLELLLSPQQHKTAHSLEKRGFVKLRSQGSNMLCRLVDYAHRHAPVEEHTIHMRSSVVRLRCEELEDFATFHFEVDFGKGKHVHQLVLQR